MSCDRTHCIISSQPSIAIAAVFIIASFLALTNREFSQCAVVVTVVRGAEDTLLADILNCFLVHVNMLNGFMF